MKLWFLSMMAFACTLVLGQGPARAQSLFFMSPNGSDTSNNCQTQTTPCQTINHLLTLSPAAGSEVDCELPGQVITSSITLSNSITINCPGSVGTGSITVNGGSSSVVTLRGLHLQGFGGTATAIPFSGGGTLNVDDMVIEGFSSGVLIGSGGNVSLTNTAISNTHANGNILGGGGISVFPQSSSDVALVSLSHVTLVNNDVGLAIEGTGKSEVNLVESVVSSSGGNGVQVIGSGSNLQFLTVQRSSLVMNGSDGLSANGASAFVLIGESSLAWNANFGVQSASSALVFSYGNNQINGNGGASSGGDISGDKSAFLQ